jgi:hypothetical protein
MFGKRNSTESKRSYNYKSELGCNQNMHNNARRTDGQTDRRTDGEDGQTDRWTYGQTDRQNMITVSG